MTILITASEIRKVIAEMKPNKSPGCDKIPVELIKYAPERMHEQIAKIYNMAETGDINAWHIKTTWKAKQSERSAVESENYYPNFLPTQDPCSMYHQQNQR